jgi:membrane protein
LFLGAEFTQVYAKSYGSKIQPAENAVPITEEERAQQGIPRKEDVEEVALMEREVGGTPTSRAADGSAAEAQATKPQTQSKAGAGAVTAFFLGLLLGRRQRPK